MLTSIDDLRPQDLYEKILLLREKCGVEFYVKESSSFVNSNCPACDNVGEEKFNKYGFKHLECRNCKTLYVSPRPSEKKLFEYYSNYEAPSFWNQILIGTDCSRKAVQHSPRVQKLIKVLEEIGSGKGVCVEIGAGNGNFSKTLSETFYFNKIIPLDVSEICVKSCIEKGLEFARIGVIDDIEDGTADCIVFNDLIEHVFNPLSLMESCYRKLNKKGVIFLTTPNGVGFDFILFGKDTVNITPPEHLQYFNPYSIAMLAKNSGFSVFEITTPGKLDVEIVRRQTKSDGRNLATDNSYLNYILEEKNSPNLLTNFQKFLSDNKLSSHMMLIAYKK